MSAREFAKKSLARIYAALFRSPHWRVGYRRADVDVWETQSLAGTRWRVLKDPKTRFLADPIAFEHDGRLVLFVEDFDHATQKGVISAIDFDENGPRGDVRRVLEEDWHLSYPLVFAAEDAVWMIPESSESGEITLYRADPFPDCWVKARTLVSGLKAVDATIFQRDGRYWLLATKIEDDGVASDLHVFSSDALFGPWRPHAGNPVLRDEKTARSAGPIVQRDGRIWRPVQDCSIRYGASVGLAEITRIDDEGYEQILRAELKPCREWPGRRLHTLSQAGGFEFIDGSANVFRWSR